MSEKKVAQKNEVEKKFPVVVASLVDHPITFKYGASEVRLSGRARARFEDESLLQNPLPKGLASKRL